MITGNGSGEMMSYMKKKFALLGVDIVFVWLSAYLSYLLRFEGDIPEAYLQQCAVYLVTSMFTCTFSMLLFRLYSRIWQYAGVGELMEVVKAVSVGCAVSYAITYVITDMRVPLSVMLLSFETLLLGIGGVRFGWRLYEYMFLGKRSKRRKALIIGAGDFGTLVAKKLLANSSSAMAPIAFIDDNREKHKQQVCGIPVLGGRSQIKDAVIRHEIDDIIIAIPSANKKEIVQIIDICKLTKANLKIVPGIHDLIHGKVSINSIRNVDVSDLLGREPVKVDLRGIAGYVEHKSVLVTGAGGSIGSELCRQIATFRPKKLLLLGHGENSIYSIEMELRRRFTDLPLESIIADVQDMQRMEDTFRRHLPEVVFHAAAHKHVPLMESNPAEAVKNNVLGTKHVADCSHQFGAERFVLISTDKAVNPTSVMGATKRIAEMYIQSLDRDSQTKFVAVRFGNVLESRGSVIPRFKEQIAAGGPVTVTHPEMIRYFMTIPEAVQLVIQAGSFAEGGEVFVLDMGKPVKIMSLAEDLIRLSGFEPYKEIDIAITGIRPGEKLYEELLTNEEGLTSTRHDRIFIGQPTNINPHELDFSIKKLEKVIGEDNEVIREMLKHIVPTYENVSSSNSCTHVRGEIVR